MITANELRLGNWILVGGTGEWHTAQVTIDNLRQLVYHSDFAAVQPIPLTPEILIACGFTKHSNSNEYWDFYTLKSGWHIGKSLHSEKSAGVINNHWYWGENYKEVEHLHQLQNLVYALTGTELTYNP